MPSRPVLEIVKNRKLIIANKDASVSEAATMMAEARVGALLIMEGQQILGIFTERDCAYRVVAKRLDPETTQLHQVMTKEPYHIEAHRPFREALYMMLEHGIRHVPVIQDGAPIGVVSPRDALGRDLVEFEKDEFEREHIEEIL